MGSYRILHSAPDARPAHRLPDLTSAIVEPSSLEEAPALTEADRQGYVDRLLRLVPSDVIALYLFGVGVIPAEQRGALLGWALVGLIGVIVTRAVGTRPAQGGSPQWATVGVSSVSYVLWLYAIGGPFVAFGIHEGWIGSLLVAGWTFFLPYVYKGDPAAA